MIKKKISKSRKPKAAAAPAEHPDITEQAARTEARRLIINAVPAITRALIAEAGAGHYLHARMLFDFAALTAANDSGGSDGISPIVKLFMDELQLKPPVEVA